MKRLAGAVAVLALTLTLAAQPTPMGSISGVIVDDSGALSGGEVTPPVIVRRVSPEWPEIDGRDSSWLFSAVITKDGRVSDLKLEKGRPDRNSRAAAAAINQWRFKPATSGGVPVAVKFRLTVHRR